MSESKFYRATLDSVQLWISELTTDRSRSVVIHPPAAGDGGVVQDRGQVTGVPADARLLFDYMRGDSLTPLDRLNEFKALLDGEDHTFTHPVEGSYKCKLGRFRYTINESGTITADLELIATQPVRDALRAGTASIPAAGTGLVDAAADAFTAEFEDAGLDDEGLGALASASADDWVAADTTNPRQVLVQTGQLSTSLSDKASGLANDHETWEAFKRTVLLGESVYVAAKTVLSDSSSTIDVLYGNDTTLRALLAAEFGADEVDLRYQQVIDLNDLATPGFIEAGTQLQLPAKPPRARNG